MASDDGEFYVTVSPSRPYSFGIDMGSGDVSIMTVVSTTRIEPEKVRAIPFPCRFICAEHGPTNHFFDLDGVRECCACSPFLAAMAMRENARVA